MTRMSAVDLGLIAGLLLMQCGATAFAEEPLNPAKRSYLKYCSACHGESARGDGVVGHLMMPKPTDLTQLAKSNGGEFPYLHVMKVIDGRQTVRAHGDSGMPVWGEVFRAESTMTVSLQAEVRGKVMLITDHLDSVQAK